MDIQYHQYTAKDIKDWLFYGVNNGLSKDIITPVRAEAILHNPFVKDDMVLVISATVGEQIVGYTAMFPDYLARPNIRLSCATTLYADDKYAGEFIGFYVSKYLHTTAEDRLVIGSDIAPATVLIDKLLGLEPAYFTRMRHVLNRHIKITNIKQLYIALTEPIRRLHNKNNWRKILAYDTSIRIEYCSTVDSEAYSFIKKHSDNDAFLRKREMLSWIVQHPFVVEAKNKQYVRETNIFTSQISQAKSCFVKVYLHEELVGVYMLSLHNHNARVLLLYYSPKYQSHVFSSLLRQIHAWKPNTLYSQYKELDSYIINNHLALRSYSEKYVFTHPNTLNMSLEMQLQGADGDMFA